jgi:hypothetical protein
LVHCVPGFLSQLAGPPIVPLAICGPAVLWIMGKLTRAPDRLAVAPSLVAHAPKVALPFYYSPAWRALVAAIKRARGAWCEKCGAGGRLYADHIVEIRDGGALLDESNVQLLCHGCHQRKTARAKAARSGV